MDDLAKSVYAGFEDEEMFNTTNGCRYKYTVQLERKTKIALLVIFSVLALASTQLVNNI
jgi:hypothetical protein